MKSNAARNRVQRWHRWSAGAIALASLPLGWLATGCPAQAVLCSTDGECPGDQLCIEQVCRHTCNVTAECETGERCQQGYCAPARDATSGDAAQGDAATGDAATGDARAGDQGTGDRTANDRLLLDRQPIDATSADTPSRDAAVRDGAGADRPADCAHAGLSCTQPHTRCDDSSGTPVCACVVGYAAVGGPCEWTGGPLDPGFQQLNAWTVGGSAVVDTAAVGSDDRGSGRFPPEAACSTGGVVEQIFEMPALADAEPLVLRFKARSIMGMGPYCFDGFIRVVINGGVYQLNLFGSAWQDETICLGARAYGAPLEIAFEVPQQCMLCFGPDEAPSFEIDNVRIAVDDAGACPAFGTVVNGDFESGSWGWQPSANDTSSAAVVTGVGTGGSLGGAMAMAHVCDYAALTGQVSLPAAGQSPTLALQYLSKGTANQSMPVTLGPLQLAIDVGTGAFETRRLCLLDGLKGLVYSLGFSISGPAGLCSDPYLLSFVIDDVALVDEPTCPAGVGIFDPGFENVVAAPQLHASWRYAAYSGAAATPYENAAAAHTGNVSARLLVNSICASASVSTVITVPPASGQAGPAVALWYRLPTATSSSLWVGEQLPVATIYSRFVHCLEPALAGRTTALTIALSNSQSGTCGNSATTETAWIDDVEVTTDPGCPP